MRDIGGNAKDERSGPDGHVGLALEVIQRLAVRRQSGVDKLRPIYLSQMIDAVCSSDGVAVSGLVEVFRKARIPAEVIADDYIPATARALGLAWQEDRLSFGHVTIGAARLQSLLHMVQQDAWSDFADPGTSTAVLVLVPPGEQHTLGAMVAASMLRRRGVSVSLQIAPKLSDLSVLLAGRRFNAALLTIGSADRVEICANLIKTLKQMTKGALRVAVGGAVSENCLVALMETGADLVTNDVNAVISEFGLDSKMAERNAG